MLRNKFAAIAVAAALGMSVGLAGCGGGGSSDAKKDSSGDATATATDSGKKDEGGKKKGFFDTTGYQGRLEDGKDFVYMHIGSGDDVVVSIADPNANDDGESADAYQGAEVKDADGRSTVTDEESSKTITFTLVENEDGTAEVEVEGHGKGSLKTYEGNLFSVIGSMADDDAETSDAAE